MQRTILLQLIISLALCFNSIYAYAVVVGGYTDVNIKEDKTAQKAIDFAIKKINKGKLSKIILIQRQLVNGLNYKMQLEIINTNNKKIQYEVVLYKSFTNDNTQNDFKVIMIKKI